MLVIGTAGHIDHGKSSIVKRLTGTDPDRLPEEQARGMTIDLGFAFYETAANRTIAFVDVPGHERFVKNMIAGAGGIDAVMLVVAADDGWMPQSEEHFQIVKLLGIRHGLVVINKCDLVESDWLQLLEKEIRGRLADSFLADARIVPVSAATGDGFEELQGLLNALALRIEQKQDIGKARLYIDRTFVRQGIGGVVTGTLRGGSLSTGQTVAVWPSSSAGKIRSLQTHNQEVEQVVPGDRTAVAVGGVERTELVRGGVVSGQIDLGYLNDHPVLALSVSMLPSAAVPLADRRRLLLLVGTTEAEGEIRLFNTEHLGPGETGLAFFRPDDPVYALVNDRAILRLPTPMTTLGGAIILDHLAAFPRRKELASLDYLRQRDGRSLVSLILSELAKQLLADQESMLVWADISASAVHAALVELAAEGKVMQWQQWWFVPGQVSAAAARLKVALSRYLSEHPHLKGVSLTEVAELLQSSQTHIERLVSFLVAQGELNRNGELIDLAGRTTTLKGMHKAAYERIIADLRAAPYAPPSLQSFASQGKHFQEAIRYLMEHREAYKCGTDFLLLADVWKEVVAFIRERLNQHGQLSVTELRDRFGFSRKYAIPILEEADRLRLTERKDDVRVKGARFEQEDTFL